MKSPKAMMFYPEPWLASPQVMAMDAATRAGYFDILCAMWLQGGALPDDDKVLASCSRLKSREWKAGRDQIRAMLTPTEDGKSLTQNRLADEYERTVALQKKKKKAAKAGAEARWGKSEGNARRMPDACQTHSDSNAGDVQTETDTTATPNGVSVGRFSPQTFAIGEFKFARVTEEELHKLHRLMGPDRANEYLEAFDLWVAEDPTGKVAGGKRRKDRTAYRSILNWHHRDKRKNGAASGRSNGEESIDNIRDWLASKDAV